MHDQLLTCELYYMQPPPKVLFTRQESDGLCGQGQLAAAVLAHLNPRFEAELSGVFWLRAAQR